MSMSRPEYLFGDGDTAAQRLKLLASVYQESTRAFLSRAAGSARFRLVLDLGCGPGFTTHLISDALR
jgi:trans-aconitate 2-methyltransferase